MAGLLNQILNQKIPVKSCNHFIWISLYDTPAAYRDTLLTNPANWKSTAMQVGGFRASATNNRDGTVTFRIRNVAGANSFFLHAIPNRKSATGLMSNVEQIFEWTEPIDPNRLPKINDLTDTKSIENRN